MTLTSNRSAERSVPANPGRPAERFAAIDRLRGLAILLMIGDHVSIFTGLEWYRDTAGRVAMPLFFVLSGYLVTRFTIRHALVGLSGFVLAAAVPWVDSPNVLVWYCAGAALLACSWVRQPLVLAGVAVFGLMLAANGYAELYLTGYNPFALLGIMAVGALLRTLPDGRTRGPRRGVCRRSWSARALPAVVVPRPRRVPRLRRDGAARVSGLAAVNALRLLGWSLIALGTLLCLWWALLTVADL